MAYQSVCKIVKKGWTAGLCGQNERGNFHVGMKEMEVEFTWKNNKEAQFIPFTDDQGHQGMRVIIK